jgi:hypothetical protein
MFARSAGRIPHSPLGILKIYVPKKRYILSGFVPHESTSSICFNLMKPWPEAGSLIINRKNTFNLIK